jgi:hypothetical protein
VRRSLRSIGQVLKCVCGEANAGPPLGAAPYWAALTGGRKATEVPMRGSFHRGIRPCGSSHHGLGQVPQYEIASPCEDNTWME